MLIILNCESDSAGINWAKDLLPFYVTGLRIWSVLVFTSLSFSCSVPKKSYVLIKNLPTFNHIFRVQLSFVNSSEVIKRKILFSSV